MTTTRPAGHDNPQTGRMQLGRSGKNTTRPSRPPTANLGQSESSPPTTELIAPNMFSPEDTDDPIVRSSKYMEKRHTSAYEGNLDSIVEETQWGSVSATNTNEEDTDSAQTPLSCRADTPLGGDLPNKLKASPWEINEAKTQDWVESTAMPVAAALGVSFGTSCKCGRDILNEIKAQAQVELQRRMDYMPDDENSTTNQEFKATEDLNVD